MKYIRLDAEDVEDLRRMAAEQDRPVAYLVRKAVREFLDAHEGKGR